MLLALEEEYGPMIYLMGRNDAVPGQVGVLVQDLFLQPPMAGEKTGWGSQQQKFLWAQFSCETILGVLMYPVLNRMSSEVVGVIHRHLHE